MIRFVKVDSGEYVNLCIVSRIEKTAHGGWVLHGPYREAQTWAVAVDPSEWLGDALLAPPAPKR